MKIVGPIGGALLAIGLGSPLIAADMPVKAPRPVAVQSWTGCYVGTDAGGITSRNEGFSTTPASTQGPPGFAPVPGGFVGNVTDEFSLLSPIFSVHGGCNYQVARWVFGIEADLSYADQPARRFANAAAVAVGFNPQRFWDTNPRTLATARFRLGYTVTDQWLLYATGGGAWAKISNFQAALNNVAQFQASETDTPTGWTAGFGGEYMVNNSWSIRSEFLYLRIPRYTAYATTPPGSAMLTNMTAGPIDDYIVRVGASYKFGWKP